MIYIYIYICIIHTFIHIYVYFIVTHIPSPRGGPREGRPSSACSPRCAPARSLSSWEIQYHSLPAHPHYHGPGMIYFWGSTIKRPYGALNIFHTGGSVVGVGVLILVLRNAAFARHCILQDSRHRVLHFRAPIAILRAVMPDLSRDGHDRDYARNWVSHLSERMSVSYPCAATQNTIYYTMI